MRFESYVFQAMPATATTGTSTPIPSRNLRDKYVQISGIAGGGVAKIEGTIDGANWVTAANDGAINADGVYAVAETFDQVRINRSTAGTGTWVATLVGFDVRAGG